MVVRSWRLRRKRQDGEYTESRTQYTNSFHFASPCASRILCLIRDEKESFSCFSAAHARFSLFLFYFSAAARLLRPRHPRPSPFRTRRIFRLPPYPSLSAILSCSPPPSRLLQHQAQPTTPKNHPRKTLRPRCSSFLTFPACKPAA